MEDSLALSCIHTFMELSHGVVESVRPECRFSLETSMRTQNSAAFKETSNGGHFILVCIDWPVCVSRKQFLLSVTPPTSLRTIPSPQKKSDVDVGPCLTFPTITPGTNKLGFCFMLCRGVCVLCISI